jgi:hypothetical protein
MVRDTAAGKVDFRRVLDGPMLDRWAAHLSKGAVKYPDVGPGVPNWTLAAGPAELDRFKQSAFRHFLQWLRGDVDEDHAAAVFFNINGAEYVEGQSLEPAAERSLLRRAFMSRGRCRPSRCSTITAIRVLFRVTRWGPSNTL